MVLSSSEVLLRHLWERLSAAINDGSTVLLKYSRLEAAPTR